MGSGNLFIISAPSGTGKTTILKRIISGMERIGFSVSHTTRPQRKGEVEGRDYYFTAPAEFQAMKDQDSFLEFAEVHGNMYGTSRAVVDNLVREGKDVILDIDVQGARQIRDKINSGAVYVFIAPPSLKELELRLTGRGTEEKSAIATRLQNARDELADIYQYDYVIVNDILEDAVDVLRAIIIAERSRKRRSIKGLPLQFEKV